MSNLARAISWAKLGCPVFPCYEIDTWVGQKLHKRKSPRTSNGFKGAVTDLEIIESYWEANPAHLVGVVPREIVVLDIDKDSETGKDGWFELSEAGIEVPSTFSVDTPSGGNHYFFRAEKGKVVPPVAGLTLPSGLRLPSVDRRSGGSYFIAWAESTPTSILALEPCPLWLEFAEGKSTSNYLSFTGGLKSWVEGLAIGTPSSLVKRAIERFPKGEFGHSEMISKQAELVHLGAAREEGVEGALDQLRALWLKGSYDTLHYQSAWESALVGAISKFGGLRESESLPREKSFEERTIQVLEELRARRAAERILASEDSPAIEEFSWDELGEGVREYLVQDLVPKQAIVFLSAKSNTGKTFAYIDMVCRMQAGMTWLGKKTTQAKVLIVLGEGLSSFKSRLRSWCVLNSVPENDIKDYFRFVSRANLSSDASLEQIRDVALAHGAELIIYDTWSNVSGVVSEDDAAMNSAALRGLTNALPHPTHFFVHHPRKSSEEGTNPVMRGSTTLQGRADVVMSMFRDKDYISAHAISAEFLAVSTEANHAGKNRDAQTETIRGAYLQSVDECVSFAYDATPPLARRTALAIVRLTREMTVQEYAKSFEISESAARRELKEGVRAGHVVEKKSKHRNVATKYIPRNLVPAEVNWTELVNRIA